MTEALPRIDNEEDEEMNVDSGEEVENGIAKPSREWTTMDMYHGLVPKFLAEDWALLLRTSKSTAAYLAGRFVERIENYGKTKLWKERCSATVEWERSQGITKKKRRGRVLEGGTSRGFD